jgi:branched-subunit amino acid aminotransferase/4-amino-4-deoxychorismate lyase
MAKIEANACGVDEAMCLENNGYIAEGVGENVFIVRNGELFTPPTSTGALSGITAEVVAEIAAKIGIKVNITNLTPFMLFTADEAFFTGTAMEMAPIREVNKRLIGDGKPGVVTKKLMAEFHKVICDPTQGTKTNCFLFFFNPKPDLFYMRCAYCVRLPISVPFFVLIRPFWAVSPKSYLTF